MLNKQFSVFFNIVVKLLTVAAITVCVLPGYKLLGNLSAQIAATAFCTLITVIIADIIFRLQPKDIANSLIFMTVFWVQLAIAKQLDLHIYSHNYSLKWFHLFYYDRPALLFVVFAVCMIYYIAKLIIKSKSKEFTEKYKIFIKRTVYCLSVYYIIVLIYSFIISRRVSIIKPEMNLIPFDTIISTFSLGRIDYELFFLFLGNIAIFFPLGIFVSALTERKVVIVLAPLIVSGGIEFSQFIFGNGHPDIDDLILNVLGFYIGVFVKYLLDIILEKVSDGRLSSVFVFK